MNCLHLLTNLVSIDIDPADVADALIASSKHFY